MVAQVIISGFVQGVGFRFFIREHAEQLALTGWVKNTTHGTVEAVFQGEKSAIEKILMLCKQGPPAAQVDDVQVHWKGTNTTYASFEILK